MAPSPKELACLALRLTLVPTLIRHTVQRRRVTMLLYHRPEPATLERHLRFLCRAYNPISLREYLEARRRGTLAGLPARALVITFDDGHRSNRDLVPLFERVGVPPTIFLCSGIVDTEQPFWFDVVDDPAALKAVPDSERVAVLERAAPSRGPRPALNAQEIESMRDAVDFQAHTVTHPILPRCDDIKAEREIADSRTQLEGRYGLDVYALAYPNGDYTDRDVALTRSAGYDCAVTVDHGFNDAGTDLFRLRRIGIDDVNDGPHALALKACGLWGRIRAAVKEARA